MKSLEAKTNEVKSLKNETLMAEVLDFTELQTVKGGNGNPPVEIKGAAGNHCRCDEQ